MRIGGRFLFILFLFSSFVCAQDAAQIVEPQNNGGTSTYKVRVAVNYPAGTSEATAEEILPDSTPANPVVTIDEFPGGPIVSEPIGPGSSPSRILATLYGEPITEEDVVKEMWPSRGKETFEWIVGRDILRRELRRLRLDVSDSEVDQSLARHLAVLKKAYPNLRRDDDLARAASGMPLAEYRERTVWTELALRKIMNAVLDTREEDLIKFFATVRADYIKPERVQVSQIFIAPRSPADDGIADSAAWDAAEREIVEAYTLLKRQDFPDVARIYGSGGTLSRWVRRGDLLRELETPAFTIGPGSWTNPIKTSMGWHILMVEAREERKEPRLDDVRADVKARFEEERFLRLAGEFMARLKEKTVETGGLVIAEEP